MNVRDLFAQALVEELTPLYPGGEVLYQRCIRPTLNRNWPEVILRDLEGHAIIQIQPKPDGVYVGGQRAGLKNLLPWEAPNLVELIIAAIDEFIPTDPYTTLEQLKGVPAGA